ncbi:MAG TPA: hypothetical protein VGX23_14220 [Actinocrinis sp.]|nr:hypothetical protein [Actinocrinis sp.]
MSFHHKGMRAQFFNKPDTRPVGPGQVRTEDPKRPAQRQRPGTPPGSRTTTRPGQA